MSGKLILPPGIKPPRRAPKEKRLYRGSDNPKAHRRELTARRMRLVPRGELGLRDRPALLPGRRSRRQRRNVWVPA